MPRSRTSTHRTLHSPLDTTSSPPGPRTRRPSSSDTRPQLLSTRPKPRLSQPTTSPIPSTGDPRVLLPQSRTRDSADHAGLSPPPVPLRVLTSSRPDSSSPTLSNNSSHAPPRTTVATVDSWTTPSSTLSNKD